MPGFTAAPPLPNDDEESWDPAMQDQATRIDKMEATILVLQKEVGSIGDQESYVENLFYEEKNGCHVLLQHHDSHHKKRRVVS